MKNLNRHQGGIFGDPRGRDARAGIKPHGNAGDMGSVGTNIGLVGVIAGGNENIGGARAGLYVLAIWAEGNVAGVLRGKARFLDDSGTEKGVAGLDAGIDYCNRLTGAGGAQFIGATGPRHADQGNAVLQAGGCFLIQANTHHIRVSGQSIQCGFINFHGNQGAVLEESGREFFRGARLSFHGQVLGGHACQDILLDLTYVAEPLFEIGCPASACDRSRGHIETNENPCLS